MASLVDLIKKYSILGFGSKGIFEAVSPLISHWLDKSSTPSTTSAASTGTGSTTAPALTNGVLNAEARVRSHFGGVFDPWDYIDAIINLKKKP
jgi:hypothetical protein